MFESDKIKGNSLKEKFCNQIIMKLILEKKVLKKIMMNLTLEKSFKQIIIKLIQVYIKQIIMKLIWENYDTNNDEVNSREKFVKQIIMKLILEKFLKLKVDFYM
jgi:hypothetical protein